LKWLWFEKPHFLIAIFSNRGFKEERSFRRPAVVEGRTPRDQVKAAIVVATRVLAVSRRIPR
jgi:hypothetical protein